MRRLLLFVAYLFGSDRAAAEPCAAPTTTSELVTQLERADQAYATLDVQGFRSAVVAVRELLPCVGDPVSRHMAAEVHRHEGLLGFIDREPARSTTAFAAARLIEPEFTFPHALVPPGNAVLDEYGAIDTSEPPRAERLPEPAAGWLQLDGRTTTQRWVDLPMVVQLFGSNGAILTTAYLEPGAAPPAYEGKSVADPMAAPLPEPLPVAALDVAGPARRRPNGPLLVTAAVSAAVAGGTWGASWVSRWAYDDSVDRAELDRRQGQTNGLVITSVAATVLAAGTGVGAVVVGRLPAPRARSVR